MVISSVVGPSRRGLSYMSLKPRCLLPMWYQRINPVCNCRAVCKMAPEYNKTALVMRRDIGTVFMRNKESPFGEYRGIHQDRFTEYINNILKKV